VPGVDPSLRGTIRAKILADYGEHTMLPGNKMPRPRRLPTGSPALDYVTGGGIPFRNITRMWGYYSSGKTTALLKMFAAAQNFGALRSQQLLGLAELSLAAGESRQAKLLKDQAKRERELGPLGCMYVCPESPDPDLVAALGVDLSKIEMVRDTVIETIGDVVQQNLAAYHVVGIDSTTATMSTTELGDPNATYGSHPMKRAAAWGINLDWFRAKMSDENCVILTSQAREKRTNSKSFAAQSAEHAPGGFSLNHEPAVILHFMKGGVLKRKPNGGLEEPKKDDYEPKTGASAFGKFQAAGGVVVVRCSKNKVGVEGRSVLLHHDKRAGDFDVLHEYEKFASYYRVVAKSGTWWELPPGITTPDGKTKTQQLRSTLAANPDLRARIESVVLRCADDPVFESELLAGRTGELVEIPAVSS
jgi:RecA/RadA recombinase